MPHEAALPFTVRRKHEVFTGSGMTTTTETFHGLLRLTEDHIVVQWRLARKTEHLGGGMRTDEEVEPVRHITIPLSGIAGVSIRRPRWGWLGGSRLELTGSDLRVFEEVAGEAGFRMAHPAQLKLKIHRRDRLVAEEFAAELSLALAERSLAGDDGHPALPDGGGGFPRLSEEEEDTAG